MGRCCYCTMIAQGIQENPGAAGPCAKLLRGRVFHSRTAWEKAGFTTKKSTVFPSRTEHSTFSTGFSTAFVKKNPVFPRCFPLFPPGFPQQNHVRGIQDVKIPVPFWKFAGDFVGILPFIKKEVEAFSLFFTGCSQTAVDFFPIWNAPGPSFPQLLPAAVFLWKTNRNRQFSTTGRLSRTDGAVLVFRKRLCYTENRRINKKRGDFLCISSSGPTPGPTCPPWWRSSLITIHSNQKDSRWIQRESFAVTSYF